MKERWPWLVCLLGVTILVAGWLSGCTGLKTRSFKDGYEQGRRDSAKEASEIDRELLRCRLDRIADTVKTERKVFELERKLKDEVEDCARYKK